MQICIIAPEKLPVPGSGSVEISVWAVARKLARRHKVTVLSRRTFGLPNAAEQDQVRLVRLPSGSPSRYNASVLKFLEQERFDIIQVDNRPLLAAQIKNKLPHTPALLFLHSLTFVPATPAVARALSKPDLVATNSDSLRAQLARRFPGLEPRLTVVPLGADLSRFAPPQPADREAQRRLYRVPPAFAVLFVGRVIPRKGVPVLIRAVARLNKRHPAHLLIAGSGKPPYLRRLRALARRLHVPVTFLGSVAHENIHGLYQAADCLVCPSQQHESFGLVNVEAMASGLPVIASNNGGIREIIQSGRNGFLVDRYREAAPFARWLAILASDPQLAARIGRQGRFDALRTFEWQRTAASLEELYKVLVTPPAGHAQ
ncbi:glycosyltransferase family 4 protein [Paenibacillus sp. NFR01]|uniref:glycosyltransferase family 4 protein n=1 Tax=Paenibacillus sp. NFR01 TaxID=1566279 RepID=UPI0008B61600|nr:glycosyltransferase family 4 protein [Paenibacillus sp. NFR01]SEU23720.1 Glycosyltransferase involved in cell wall bisynthesis [Paenibacillus sp. NFR01]